MRHKFGYRKLNRTSEHRKALFKNMLNSLIKYEQMSADDAIQKVRNERHGSIQSFSQEEIIFRFEKSLKK